MTAIFRKLFSFKSVLTMSKNVITYNLNKPDTPVYSSYTSKLVGYCDIKTATPNDAPIGNPNYNKPFHVIIYRRCLI